MAKIKDLTPKGTKLKTAEQEFQEQFSGNLPFGQNMGGTQMYSNVFKRGYGDAVFGSDSNGIWLGAADFASAPNRQYMDGSVVFTKATITGAGQNFVSTLEWTATDENTATWSAGTIKTSNGTSYSISGGNTGNIGATTYIYLDPATSITVLQTSTTATDAAGDGKILIAVVQIGGAGSECVIDVVGSSGTVIDGAQITTGTITVDKIKTGELIVGTNVDLGTAEDAAGVTTIIGDTVTTSYINALEITALGAVTAGSFAIGSNAWHVDANGNMWWGSSATYAGATIKISSAGAVNFTTGTFSGTLSAPSGTLGAITASNISITGGSITGATSLNIGKTYITTGGVWLDDGGIFVFNRVGGGASGLVGMNASSIMVVGSIQDKMYLVANNTVAAQLENDNATFYGGIYMQNNKNIFWKDTGGNNNLYIRGDGNNNMVIEASSQRIYLEADSGIYLNGSQKTAIVPTSQGYRALYCTESPEVWFMDFCKSKEEIDPLFLEVTEGEMKFIKLDGVGYQVWRRRKGFLSTRFEQKTKEQFERNNKFWAN